MATTLNAPRKPTTTRLEARVPTNIKQLVEKAAHVQGRSITDFVIVSLEQSARQTLREHEVMQLGREDSLRFAKILIDPPKPNAALKRAFALHAKTVTMR